MSFRVGLLVTFYKLNQNTRPRDTKSYAGLTCHMNKPLLTILILIFQVSVFGQETVQQDGYYDLKIGIYQTKSLDKELIGSNPTVIEPQTKFQSKANSAFLKVQDNAIALFDRINDKGTTKPLGVLTQTSVIQVDTVFYREIYRDTSKEWMLTFNVWYAITLNGEQYYTDYKIHDFIGLQEELAKYNQQFLLVAQSTGYDDYYDRGYPNHFFAVILNDNFDMSYNSEIFNFDYGEEFWDVELMRSVETEMTEKGFEFKLYGIEDNFEGIWTGSELKK